MVSETHAIMRKGCHGLTPVAAFPFAAARVRCLGAPVANSRQLLNRALALGGSGRCVPNFAAAFHHVKLHPSPRWFAHVDPPAAPRPLDLAVCRPLTSVLSCPFACLAAFFSDSAYPSHFPDHIQGQKSLSFDFWRNGSFRFALAHPILHPLPLAEPHFAIDRESAGCRPDRRHSRNPCIAVAAIPTAWIQPENALRIWTVGVQADRSIVQEPEHEPLDPIDFHDAPRLCCISNQA